jgi:hypothetical protein
MRLLRESVSVGGASKVRQIADASSQNQQVQVNSPLMFRAAPKTKATLLASLPAVCGAPLILSSSE